MKILVVDDEKNILESLVKYLKAGGFDAVPANNGLAAKRILEDEVYDACVLDLRMPGMDGLELLKWIKNEGPSLPVIMISAYQDVRDAVEAMKLGARDYIVKPFDPDELVLRLKRIISEHEAMTKISSISFNDTRMSDFIGEGKKAREIKKIIAKISGSKANVLITGESGTGKEVTARLIHVMSDIKDKPFIPVNMGGIPDNLLESELFGYEKGAFTGAHARKTGIFELAKDGTLFLDEIGDLPMHLQVKLLRTLQDKKIQRIGGLQTLPINSRIISATNKNPEDLIRENKFREDLYFRLNTVRLELPPLRERKEDIPSLTGYLIKKLNKNMDKKIEGISDEAMDKLMSYDFPGNIRELENIMERAFIFCEGSLINSKEIDIKEEKNVKIKTGRIKELEYDAIVEALRRWNGNRTHTAKELGFTRRTLINKIREYGIKD
jgi:two-component system response regulator AtoC